LVEIGLAVFEKKLLNEKVDAGQIKDNRQWTNGCYAMDLCRVHIVFSLYASVD